MYFLAVLCFIAGASFADIVPPLYVGNIKPALDEQNSPLFGTHDGTHTNGALVEIRTAYNGLAIPPDTNGVPNVKTILIDSCAMGYNAAIPNSGLFCIVVPVRNSITNKVFARAYNKSTIEESTFYMETPVYDIPASHQSSLVVEFKTIRPIDSGDDDGDGLVNSWEELLGIDDRPTSDYDGDGASDLMEMLAGTAPDDPSSIFKIKSIDRFLNHTVVGWYSVPGKMYQVKNTPNLLKPFTSTGTVVVANGGDYELSKTLYETNQTMHYNVVIVP